MCCYCGALRPVASGVRISLRLDCGNEQQFASLKHCPRLDLRNYPTLARATRIVRSTDHAVPHVRGYSRQNPILRVPPDRAVFLLVQKSIPRWSWSWVRQHPFYHGIVAISPIVVGAALISLPSAPEHAKPVAEAYFLDQCLAELALFHGFHQNLQS